ncbi:MAG: FtsB family cell division protein [Chitinophagaceae bacterium]
MKILERIPSWLKNKYMIALIVFAVWVLFFDRNDIITQTERRSELRDLQQSKAYYEQEISLTNKELRQLDSNPALLEKYAREKYFMKKPNEELFVIPTPEASVKK